MTTKSYNSEQLEMMHKQGLSRTDWEAIDKQATLHFIFTGKQLPNQAYVFGKLTDLLSRFSGELNQLPREDSGSD